MLLCIRDPVDSSQWRKALRTRRPLTAYIAFNSRLNRNNRNDSTSSTWASSQQQVQRGGAALLVLRRVVQLLVLGRRRGEDGGHRQQHGGSVRVTHLVDHDGGQNQAEQLEGNTAGSGSGPTDTDRPHWAYFINCCIIFASMWILLHQTNVRI